MKIDLRQFESQDALNRVAVECLTDYVQMAGQGPVAVMLSGGRTPLGIYDALSHRGCEASADLTILYSDERHVSAESPDSNYGSTIPLIRALGIPDARVLRVRTEIGWRESADRYDRDLRGFLASGGMIKLGLLGLGTDGHTASLFTPGDWVASCGRFAVAIPKAQKPDRVSVTPDLMRRIERVVILAVGSEKREIVTKLIRHPDQVVAGLALKDVPVVEIWQV